MWRFYTIHFCQVEDGSVLFCFISEKGKKVIALLVFFLSQSYFILKLDVYPWASFYIVLHFFQSHMPVL